MYKKLSALILLLVVQRGFAKNTKGSLPIQRQESKIETACLSTIEKRFTDLANEYGSQNLVLDRTSLADIAWPKDDMEKQELDCYAVLLVSAATQVEAELPIKAKVSGSELVPLKCFKQAPLKKDVSKTVGQYRMSCFYAIPLNVLHEKNELKADWAKNRTDQQLLLFPVTNADIKMNCVPKTKNPDKNLFKNILKREYCFSL